MLAMTMEREYISVEEAAEREGLSAMSIRRAIKGGFLTYRAEAGRRKLLDAHELHEGLTAWRKERRRIRPIGRDA